VLCWVGFRPGWLWAALAGFAFVRLALVWVNWLWVLAFYWVVFFYCRVVGFGLHWLGWLLAMLALGWVGLAQVDLWAELAFGWIGFHWVDFWPDWHFSGWLFDRFAYFGGKVHFGPGGFGLALGWTGFFGGLDFKPGWLWACLTFGRISLGQVVFWTWLALA